MGYPEEEFQLIGNKFEIPDAINDCPGIFIGESKIRSVLLSTDLSYFLNMKADAIMVVNPFKKSQSLNQAIINLSQKPVLCDIGGGFLKEELTLQLAEAAYNGGAAGVVISKPTPPDSIQVIKENIDCPLIYTVIYNEEPIEELIEAGVDIFNISTGETTAETVEKIRSLSPEISIMANGGPYYSTIYDTIEKGANVIVVNPPTATEMLRSIFDDYRTNRI